MSKKARFYLLFVLIAMLLLALLGGSRPHAALDAPTPLLADDSSGRPTGG
jgi:hypothetical protein